MTDKRDLQQTITRLNATLDKVPKRETKREARKSERDERRARKRQKEIENASTAGGVFAIAAALVLLGYALLNPHFWWLMFVALGVGSGGARQLALASKRDGVAKTFGLPEPEKKEAHEIDALCDALLGDLKESPEVIRAFLQEPEKTVETLRLAAKAVDRRRKDLNAKPMIDSLVKQRTELTARRDAASDFEARTKFDSALRSLDGQEAALKQLTAVSDRLDGEYASLLVLLQEMRTRVAVARSTNASPAQSGLEESVTRLNAELEAITDSLQKAQGEGLLTPIDAAPMSGDATSGEKERVS